MFRKAKKALLALCLICAGSMSLADPRTQATVDNAQLNNAGRVKIVDVDPALWVVKDRDTTIYLFGTIHILKPGLGWFDDEIKRAFDTSDELVVEMIEPPADEALKKYLKYALSSDGKTLSSKLSPADRDDFLTLVKKLGLKPEDQEPLDPWALAVTFQLASLQDGGYDPVSGVDGQLEAAAKAVNKPIRAVETFDSQLAIFDALPESVQVRFLMESVRGFDEMGKGMAQLVDTWSKPDPDALANLMNDGLSDPLLYDRLLKDRNAQWAQWINQRLARPGTVFMAVGAGHLAGKDSVQMLLKKYRIKAKRVKY
jgi:hypothetical protein